MKKVIITGANGLLGQALIQVLKEKYEIIGTGLENNSFLPEDGWRYHKLDITNSQKCKDAIKEFVPEVIINAASFTDVDGCEKEKELCWQVNVKGVENLAKISRGLDIHLIHYSTDYVFDGKEGPYDETARPDPVGYYGKSKLASENVLQQIGCPFTVIRTCVLYGNGVEVKRNFFLWVLENLQNEKKIRVVTDQFNNPTLSEDLATGSQLVIEQAALGKFHLAGRDYLSRYDFALKICGIFNKSEEFVVPIKTKELGQAAPRPSRGGLKIDCIICLARLKNL
ncbi:MAG: dTDP-4-dehydrorhamnose reductase [Calditrichota bacterium]